MAVAGTAGAHEDRSVGDNSVDDRLSADALRTSVGRAALNQVKADLRVVDGDALEGPAPVPDRVDG